MGIVLESLADLRRPPSAHRLAVALRRKAQAATPADEGGTWKDLNDNVNLMAADLPGLIISGYAEAQSIEHKPADVAVLTKPFAPEDISRLIAELCPAELSPAESGRTIGPPDRRAAA
jgi:hypothetical protein